MPDAPTKPRRKRNDGSEPKRGPGGRPHELDRVFQTRDGRKITVAEAAIERIGTGIPIKQAAGGLGVRMQTIHDWRRRGVRARARQIAGETITDADELRLIEFADRCDEAEARAFSTDWTRLGTIAAGGLERVTVTERQALDREGNVVTLRDRKVETLLPDARAIQWRMAVRFGLTPRTQVELTGADGGPVEVDVLDVRASRVADRFGQFLEATAREVAAVPDLAPDGNGRPGGLGPAELGEGGLTTPQGPPSVRERILELRARMADIPSPDVDVPPPPD